MFGTRFTSTYGEDPCKSWAIGLGDITAFQIDRGIDNLINSGEEWPPSLPKFRKLCLTCAAPVKQYTALTHEPTDEQKRNWKANCLKLRAALLGTTVDALE